MSGGARARLRRRRSGSLARAALAAAVGLWLGSCSSAGRPPLPPSAAVVTVGMRDFAFDVVPAVNAGRAVFRADNRGEHAHDLYLAPVPDDLPPAAELFGPASGRQPLAPVAVLKPLAPGEHGSFAYDLAPGRYVLVCLLQTPNQQSHAVLGMAADLRVERARGPVIPTTATTERSTSPRGSPP